VELKGRALGSHRGGAVNAERLRKKSQKEYYQKPNICLFCSSIIQLPNGKRPAEIKLKKFCNQSCSASFNNKKRKKQKFCESCGVELQKTQKKYCSIQCQRDKLWKEKKQEIKRLGKLPPSPRIGRRYFLEKHGNKCFLCKREIWNDKPIPLNLDHIDGNSENWRLHNLRLICPNCDAQSLTYKGRNRGNGRWKRRMRYKLGKSS
jgi:hypothetical protein